ncbi:hypothetical protein [Sphingobacterium alkalisoli]|nr:hypothetical protein [Sphingobacterium alkalisoli]
MKKIKEKEKDETRRNFLIYEYSALYMHKEYITFTTYQPQEETSERHFSPYSIDYRFKYLIPIFRPPIS